MGGFVGTGGDPTRNTGRRIIGGFFEGLIDYLFLGSLVKLFDVRVGQGVTGVPTPQADAQGGKIAWILVLYLVWIVATKVITLGFFGWTPGMLMMSLRCVRYDGRPPGLWRALVRTLIFAVYEQLGCIFVLTAWAPMSLSKSHRALWDMPVSTWVIDSIYQGHLLIPTGDGGVFVGPESVTRTEANKLLAKEGAPPVPAVNVKSGEPFLDKNLDTYVVWSAKRDAWLAYDKASGEWYQIG